MSILVCLEGIEHGNRFYTSCSDKDEDHTRLKDGTVAYKVLGYADTPDEALEILHGPGHNSFEKRKEIFGKYLERMEKDHPGLFTQSDINDLSTRIAFHESDEEQNGSFVYYAKYDTEYHSFLSMGWNAVEKNCPALIEKLINRDLDDSHTLLGIVQEQDINEIFRKFQGEIWSPNGEANDLLDKLGIEHTSMSVGDIIIKKDKLYFCDLQGWKEL